MNGKKQISANDTRENAKYALSMPRKNSPINEKLKAQIQVTKISFFKTSA